MQAFFDRWQVALPSPLSAEDRARGYYHELAFRQAEISDIRMFDRPTAGRAWLSGPCQTSSPSGALTRWRSCSAGASHAKPPGGFTPRSSTRGVEPSIQVHYRASKVKQYFKEGRALRTETTINDTRDFGIGRRLTEANWEALVSIGHQVNQRFLDHQLQACQSAPDAATLQRVVLPSIEDGLPAPGLRFGEPRTMALLACLCCFQHLFAGLTNRTLRELIAGLIPGYTARQMTYDLRRLRRKKFIQRISRTQRYELTSEGRRLAVFLTKTYTQIVNPSSPSSTQPSRPTSPTERPSPKPGEPSSAPSKTGSPKPRSSPEKMTRS